MKLNEYQLKCREFLLPTAKNEAYLALGLVGEAGEVAEKIKKNIRDGKLDIADLQKELGDVLFYLGQLSLHFGMDLEGVAQQNIAKLSSRKSRGKIGGSGDNR